MIRVISACSVAGILLFAASDSGAAPKAGRKKRSSRPAAGLESADPAVRSAAISRMVADRDPTAVAQLALALEGDDDESVRQAAAAGLGELADKRGIGALRRCLQLEQSQVVKRSCRVSLAELDPEAATTDPGPISAVSAAGAAGPSTESPAATPGVPAATPGAPAATPGAPAATLGAPAATPGAPAATPGAPAATPGTPAAGPQLDLRINVTAQDAAKRPNHVYIELWSGIDKNTLALGFERVVGPHLSVALEPQFSAESQSVSEASVSAVAVALAVRPHFYFLQQAPSGPYIAPFAAVGYSRVTFDLPSGFPEADDNVSGTVWAVGGGVGWSLAVNARAVFKLSAVFSYAKTAATFGTSGVEQSSSSAAFSPFVSAGVML